MFLKYITLISGFNYLIFAGVLLFRNSPLKKANQILGSIFLIMAFYSIILSYYSTALLNKDFSILSFYLPIDYLLVLLMGPFLYFYIKSILNESFSIQFRKLWYHFIPLLPALCFIIYFITLQYQSKIQLLVENFETGIWQTNLLNGLFYLQMTTYLFICYSLIKSKLKSTSKVTLNYAQVEVSWLKTFIIIDIAIMLLSAPLCFYFANERTTLIIAQLAMDIQFMYIFVKSAWQTGIFTSENVVEIKSKESVLKIDDQTAEDYFKILIEFINEKKPYLNEDCNIQNVSDQTGISIHHLSNILNKRVNKSFPDFINEFRINDAKKILNSTQFEKITLEAIGYECGFGSKSSFNKAFKKFTNLTPSEYRLKNKKIIQS